MSSTDSDMPELEQCNQSSANSDMPDNGQQNWCCCYSYTCSSEDEDEDFDISSTDDYENKLDDIAYSIDKLSEKIDFLIDNQAKNPNILTVVDSSKKQFLVDFITYGALVYFMFN